MERKIFTVDELSTFHSYVDDSINNIVVFIHGIFGKSGKETWGATPTQLFTSPTFTNFDYCSFGYNTKTIDFNSAENFVDQLILWIKTNLNNPQSKQNYDNIFFIAHSMGGLLVRHAIIKMMQDPQQRNFVKKIRRCIMIASPITGSKLAKTLRMFRLGFLNKQVDYLSSPNVDGDNMSEAYNKATQSYINNGGAKQDIPRFSYFIGSQDKFVSPPGKEFYTDYDKYEGVIEGTHSSLKMDKNENSVLVNAIIILVNESLNQTSQTNKIELTKEAIRNREKTVQSRQIQDTRIGERNAEKVDVILISCSATKSDANETLHQSSKGIIDQVEDKRITKLIFDIRYKVLRLINEGNLDGIEFKQGNRALLPANQKLEFGPDMGGVLNKEQYLPAYERYKGRCYQAEKSEWETMLEKTNHPHVLIMSGLYGLIPATEHIQNYDIHLTDVHLKEGISLESYWKDRDLMTQILISHLEWIEKNKGPIGKIIDALSEHSYQEAINWSMIDYRWNVFHCIFESCAGRNALGNLGIWIRDVIRDTSILSDIETDKFYENNNFHPKDRIAFEKRINDTTLPVKRNED